MPVASKPHLANIFPVISLLQKAIWQSKLEQRVRHTVLLQTLRHRATCTTLYGVFFYSD